MKHIIYRFLSVLFVLTLSLNLLHAVPAYRGWQQRTLSDGTTIQVRLVGDEFYHFWETQDGKIALEQEDGTFILTSEEKPSGEQVALRRSKAPRLAGQRRAKANYGDAQPTKLLVLLVNFKDKSMQSKYGNSYFDNMLNGTGNSVREYFRASSDGHYVPDFEVWGPYTLDNNMSYYGANDSQGNDQHPDQMVVDACAKAYADGCDFSHFDENNDGKVDNIYVIYAGYGEAAGASTNTIWPHSWEIYSSNVTGTLKYNGKTLGHYACSAELSGKSGTTSDGIGTFSHEFSHVIGLPDYYDTDYGTNSDNGVTPGNWTLMDQGSYLTLPPLYSIYDKYFMGWGTPTILKDPENVNMPVGTAYARQITSNNTLAAATNTSTVYYLENRQKEGFDAYIPGHGMVVWKVTYNSTRWSQNDLNNTAGTLRYTIVPADGKTKNYGDSKDPFPGTGNVTNYTPISGHALTDITETSKVITFKYNGGISGHNVIVDGTGCTIVPSATTVENGTQLTATITPTDATYDYTSLVVKLGSTTLTSGTHYTLSSDKKTLTIKGTAITGAASNNITITVVWTKARCTYESMGDNCTTPADGTVNINNALNLIITPESGFSLADAACWTVEMGGTELTYGTDFTYNASTNTFSITKTTGDVVILAEAGPLVTWRSLGEVFTTNIAGGGKLVLPASNPPACTGKVFVGWCTNASYSSNTAPTFAKADDAIAGAATYYAVFATASGGGGASSETTYTFTSASWATSQDAWTSNSAGNGLTTGQGVQVTTSKSGAGAETKTSQSNVSKVVVNYCTNSSKGAGSIEVSVGSTSVSHDVTTSGGTSLRDMEFDFDNVTGVVSIEVTCTTNSIYINSITITSGGGASYTAYTTSCVPPTMYNIYVSSVSHGSVTTSPATQAAEGETVTITITPDEWYNLTSLTVNGGSVTVSGTGDTRTFTMPAADVTIAATFTEETKYTVRFLENGSPISTQQVYGGQAPIVPTPDACEGFTFIGWWTAALDVDNTEAKDWISDFGVTANTDFHAVYSRVDGEGGGTATWDLVTDDSSLRAGDVLVIASTSKGKTAAALSGSYLTEVSSTFGTGTITSLGEGTLEFTLGGTTGEWTLTSSAGVLGSTAAKNVSWDAGTQTWDITISDDNATIYNGTSGYGRILHNVNSYRFTTYTSQTSTIMLLPQLYRKSGGGTTYYTTNCTPPTLYNITVNSTTHGSVTTTPSESAAAGRTVTITIAPDAWYNLSTLTIKDGSNNDVAISGTGNSRTFTMPESDVTISASFVEQPQYTITFSINGATSSQTVYEGQGPDVPAVSEVCDDVTFVGWWTAELATDNTTTHDWIADFTAVANQTYYAVFNRDGTYYTTSCEAPSTVTVTFYPNGGTGTTTSQILPYNTSTALNECTFTREGYIFLGWAETADGEKVYNDRESVAFKTHKPLYAVWQLFTYTVTWKTCDGTAFATQQYTPGQSLTLPSGTPPNNTEGKAFYGWIVEEHYSGTSAPAIISAGGAVNANATYYAIYH